VVQLHGLRIMWLFLTCSLVPLSSAQAELIEVAPQANLYYETSGQGEPLLLIPGWTMTSGIWKEQVAAFSKTHRVIVVDPRGHGNSTKVLGGNTLSQHARDLRRLIEGLRLHRATVVGWSMAVGVLLEYLNQFGNERLAGLVLVDGAPYFLKGEDWPYGLPQEELHRRIVDFENDRALQTNRFVDEMFKTDRPESELEWVVKESSRTPTTVATALLYDSLMFDRRSFLSKIAVPTLIAVSAENKGMGEYMRGRIPGAQLSVFDGVGSALFLEDSKKFNEVLAAFLKSLQ
jgi:non-heme chloroperoxidase